MSAEGAAGRGPVRAFVALLLPPADGERLRESVVATLGGEAAARRGFRLPRAEGLHLTLYFLGDVERERLGALWERVRAACAGARAPALEVAVSGAFPDARHPRVLWLGLREAEGEGGRLAALRERVLAGLEAAGVDTRAERKRPFRPHVTVARPRGPGRALPGAFRALDPALVWRPDALHLMESVRGEGPARYRSLAALPLAP